MAVQQNRDRQGAGRRNNSAFERILLIWVRTSRPPTVKEGSTMPGHLNEQQLKGYRDRTLELGELVAVDSHLGGCEPCRTALAGLADRPSSASVISGVDQAR